MKIAKLLFQALALICYFSIDSFPQEFLQNHKALIKTNILIDKKFQQWMLTLETKTKKLNQSNSFTIGYDYLSSGGLNLREKRYVAYRRVFYSPPVFKYVYFFISPYTKIIHRKVFEEAITGFVFFPHSKRDFETYSFALGGDTGVQVVILKRITLNYLMGLGVGKLLSTKSYADEAPTPYHLDGQVALQLGYVF